MKTPLISIIIPIYNCAEHLIRCLESVKNQTYRNLEIILIDDGSTDSSGQIADEYRKKDKRSRVFHQENKGVSEARNFGLSVFKGEYLAFVDADDLVDSRYIERLYAALEQYQVSVAVCDAFDCWDLGIQKYVCKSFAKPIKISMERYDYTKTYAHKVVWGALYKREILKDITFCKDIFLGEDSLFFAEVLSRCNAIAYLNEKRYVYMFYRNSASHGIYDEKKRTEVEAAQKIKKIFENYPNKFQSKVKAWYCCVCLKGLKGMVIYDCIEQEWYQFLLKEARETLKDLCCSSCSFVTKISSIIWCTVPKMGGFLFKKLKGNK